MRRRRRSIGLPFALVAAALLAAGGTVSAATGLGLRPTGDDLPPLDGRPDDGLTRVVATVGDADRQPMSPGDARIEALARHADVMTVERVNGEQVAIATTRSLRDAGRLPGVVAVEPERFARTFSDDAHYGLQWGLENTGQVVGGTAGVAGADIRWPAAVAGGATGAGVVVAVIDSGIELGHADLTGRFWRNTAETCGNGVDDDGNGYVDDCEGWDFVNHDGSVQDLRTATGATVDNSHGTHVAGTIAATAGNGRGVAGVAPGARIMPLKVIENGSFPLSRAAQAIDYAVSNGAHVINASWGTSPGGNRGHGPGGRRPARGGRRRAAGGGGGEQQRRHRRPTGVAGVVPARQRRRRRRLRLPRRTCHVLELGPHDRRPVRAGARDRLDRARERLRLHERDLHGGPPRRRRRRPRPRAVRRRRVHDPSAAARVGDARPGAREPRCDRCPARRRGGGDAHAERVDRGHRPRHVRP